MKHSGKRWLMKNGNKTFTKKIHLGQDELYQKENENPSLKRESTCE